MPVLAPFNTSHSVFPQVLHVDFLSLETSSVCSIVHNDSPGCFLRKQYCQGSKDNGDLYLGNCLTELLVLPSETVSFRQGGDKYSPYLSSCINHITVILQYNHLLEHVSFLRLECLVSENSVYIFIFVSAEQNTTPDPH